LQQGSSLPILISQRQTTSFLLPFLLLPFFPARVRELRLFLWHSNRIRSVLERIACWLGFRRHTHTHNVDYSASVRIPVLPGDGRCQKQAVRLRGCVDGVALSAAAGYGRSACVCAAQGLRGCCIAAIVVSFVKL
jgi:hypothetical protein